MALAFDGKSYRTINDVTTEFKTSVKQIQRLVADGKLPAWKNEVHGTRKFRHFDDEWMAAAKEYFASLKV